MSQKIFTSRDKINTGDTTEQPSTIQEIEGIRYRGPGGTAGCGCGTSRNGHGTSKMVMVQVFPKIHRIWFH